MALTTDEQAELDELKARRRQTAGIQQTVFADQSTTFDHKSLDARISALEAKAAGGFTRYAATTKGV
jgi:hypothetical protein